MDTPSGHRPGSAEQQLFGDALSCHALLPAKFVEDGIDAAAGQALLGDAMELLRNFAQIEDSHGEEPEEHSQQDLALQRIEARLQLLSEQVTRLLRQNAPGMPERSLHWSVHGLSLEHPGPVAAGRTGRVQIELAPWLPKPLELPAEVLESAPEADHHRLWLRFAPRNEACDSALHKHLFRLHRREIRHK